MSNFSICYRLASSSKKVAWLILLALLFIQVRVAVAGCLISGYLPPPQQAEQAMQMGSGCDPCTEHSSSGKQLCTKHCEQSSDTLKLVFDLPFLAPVVLPANASLFTADAVNFATPTQVLAVTGPPPYLRFLRLLN
jgi:hypothetical protein